MTCLNHLPFTEILKNTTFSKAILYSLHASCSSNNSQNSPPSPNPAHKKNKAAIGKENHYKA